MRPTLILVFLLMSASAVAQPVPRALPADPLAGWNASVDALTRKVWPSVVQILVSGYGAREDSVTGDTSAVIGPQQSSGSGFVIDAEGYIMTNAHVVSGARRVQVVLRPANADGSLAVALTPRPRIVEARIVGITSELDLALLKIEGIKVPPLPLATYSELRQGETVFAFGSPQGLRNSLTHGMVSAVSRQLTADSPLIYVQTDAPINPGNSGGPLVNIRGEVVGVNTFILSNSGGNEGLGFAVPSATVRTVFRQLRQYGHLRRQEIGISMQTITPTLAQSLKLARDYGVIVSDVDPAGPAAKAGVVPGDILVSVDGQPADNVPSITYNFRLRDTPSNVQLVLLRGEAQISIAVPPMEERAEFDSVSAKADPATHSVPELGIIGLEIDPAIAAAATGLRDPYGIIVIARTAGGVFPIQARDVIRSINNRRVATLQSLRESVRELKIGTPVTLQIQRAGQLMYLSFTFE